MCWLGSFVTAYVVYLGLILIPEKLFLVELDLLVLLIHSLSAEEFFTFKITTMT